MVSRYEIYIGLNDKDNLGTNIDEERIRSDFVSYFSCYQIHFSLNIIDGGYIRDDGGYVIERSIKLTLIDDYETNFLDDFIRSLKNFYNQESILFVKSNIEREYQN